MNCRESIGLSIDQRLSGELRSTHLGRDVLPLITSVEESRIDYALRHYRRLKQLRRYVDQHLDGPIRIKIVASALGISSSRLSHLFIEKTGVSFSLWIRHRRIRAAMVILCSDDRSVLDVALSAGYSNLRTFERSFRAVTGTSPTEYRRLVEPHHLSD